MLQEKSEFNLPFVFMAERKNKQIHENIRRKMHFYWSTCAKIIGIMINKERKRDAWSYRF